MPTCAAFHRSRHFYRVAANGIVAASTHDGAASARSPPDPDTLLVGQHPHHIRRPQMARELAPAVQVRQDPVSLYAQRRRSVCLPAPLCCCAQPQPNSRRRGIAHSTLVFVQTKRRVAPATVGSGTWESVLPFEGREPGSLNKYSSIITGQKKQGCDFAHFSHNVLTFLACFSRFPPQSVLLFSLFLRTRAGQSQLYGTGMSDEEMNQPQIGIMSNWFEGNP